MNAIRQKPSWAAKILLLYAIATAITPEFDFFGIPKIRLTDLLLPILFIAGTGPKDNTVKPSRLGLVAPVLFLIMWDLTALLLLGRVDLTPGIYYIGKRAVIFLMFFRVASIRVSRDDWAFIIQGLIYASPFLCLSAAAELGTVQGAGTEARASGIIKNQEQSTAYFLVLIISLILGIWSSGEAKGSRSFLLLGSLGACFFGLLSTGTKGGLILAVFCAGILLVRQPKQTLPIAFLLLGVSYFGWIYLPVGLQERFARIEVEATSAVSGLTDGVESIAGDTGANSVAERMVAANDVIRIYIPESPIWGLGTGFRPLGFVDDFYLTECVYHGAVGLFLWLVFQIGLLIQLRKATAMIQDPFEKGVATATTLTVVAYSIGCLSADMFYLIRPCEALFLVSGLVIGRARYMKVEKTDAPLAVVQTVTRPSTVWAPRPSRALDFTPRPLK